MVTGVSIIRLANEGAFGLHDKVAPILDPYFAKQGWMFKGAPITMEALWGKQANDVTIWQLATMTSGVLDFDTAKPSDSDPSHSVDPFRATVYSTASKDWTPQDLITVPWVANGTMEFPPGTDSDYSSTNFVLLGLILANHAGVTWDKYDQGSFGVRPAKAIKAGLLKNTQWAVHGAPEEFTPIHGYDRTCYNGLPCPSSGNGALPGKDVSKVHGVFGGWTASDIVAPVQDIANLAMAIYGPQSDLSLVTPDNITMMTDIKNFYGFATFLLFDFTGQPTDGPHDYGTCYGHLGATYGWNSLAWFMPGLNISMSVATNVESMQQAQPSDAFCVAYNRVKQILLGEPIQDCVYHGSNYFGTCVCPGSKYTCESRHGEHRCVLSYNGTLEYSDCMSNCEDG